MSLSFLEARVTRTGLLACALAAGTWAKPARAARPVFGPHDMTSLFFVSKSDNRNQVHYAVRLDAACRPIGSAPVYAYWRMLERGPAVIEPLLPREEAIYGVNGAPQSVRVGETTSTVQFSIGALRDRPVVVQARPTAGPCEALATTSIARSPAQLWNVHVATKWPVGVDHVLLQGWSVPDRRPVREAVKP